MTNAPNLGPNPPGFRPKPWGLLDFQEVALFCWPEPGLREFSLKEQCEILKSRNKGLPDLTPELLEGVKEWMENSDTIDVEDQKVDFREWRKGLTEEELEALVTRLDQALMWTSKNWTWKKKAIGKEKNNEATDDGVTHRPKEPGSAKSAEKKRADGKPKQRCTPIKQKSWIAELSSDDYVSEKDLSDRSKEPNSSTSAGKKRADGKPKQGLTLRRKKSRVEEDISDGAASVQVVNHRPKKSESSGSVRKIKTTVSPRQGLTSRKNKSRLIEHSSDNEMPVEGHKLYTKKSISSTSAGTNRADDEIRRGVTTRRQWLEMIEEDAAPSQDVSQATNNAEVSKSPWKNKANLPSHQDLAHHKKKAEVTENSSDDRSPIQGLKDYTKIPKPKLTRSPMERRKADGIFAQTPPSQQKTRSVIEDSGNVTSSGESDDSAKSKEDKVLEQTLPSRRMRKLGVVDRG